MKLRCQIITAVLSFSYYAHAGLPLCGNGSSTDFYSIFVHNYKSLAYPYTLLYQTVDEELAENMSKNCPARFDKDLMGKYLNDEFIFCQSSCERNVNSFWSKTWLFKKSKIQKNTEECVSICTQLHDGQGETLKNL